MKINRRISSNIELFEQKINYEFKNKEYILEALTHSSYSNENKNYPFNERLEFLGDSVLSIVISDYLFKKETKLPEGKYMLLGKGEEATGGRERISILADALEAVIAAIYLDGGIKCAREFILTNMEKIINDSIKGKIFRDYKTCLQEVLQSNGENNIWYKLIEEKGPDHNKRFVMEVGINDTVLGVGEGKSKKDAEQVAAKCALDKKM